MKTWEIMKRIDELGEKCIGEEYKLVKVNQGVRVGEVGMVASIGLFSMTMIALSHNGRRVDWITGQEEWEKIEIKYYLQDEFIARTNEQGSYVNVNKSFNHFLLNDCHETSIYKCKFTDEEMDKLNIPIGRYKKIKVVD